MAIVLHGYQYSVYLRIVRIVLAEKGVAYERVEVNPFAHDMPLAYLSLHPFRRVPTLVHDDFVLYETQAITRYIDEQFPGPALQSADPRHRARMAQIISIIDSYAYFPIVRQVFSQRIFGPRVGRVADEVQVRLGIEGSLRALSALEAIAPDRGPLAGNDSLSLADFHFAPMVAYLTAASEGQALISSHAKLSTWWDLIRGRESLRDTNPGLPNESLGPA
jgi:glutathione S-transferase